MNPDPRPAPEVRVIGVAFAVPEPYGGQLQSWREKFGDPLAHAIPTHVTLLPPTEVEASRLGVVEEHLRAVAAGERPFEIRLSGTGSFRPVSPVVFVRVVRGPEDCARVEHQVRSGPLARTLQFAYHPHVTVAHDLPHDVLDRASEVLATYEAQFEVWGFSLYEHGPDGMWRPQRDFPLGAQLPGPQPNGA